ncbi:ATP-binding protein [Flammeovirga kamogawensis]|uniref:ATP-binding protein n=1 Tax=Flammeovirga kamogawensis TaxID=373891 RepID=A0ABX8GQX2_9BACT|nr:ATP-binding protein [Flammeovirga kamogawensis]MBB6462084.1 DNA repair exonuclease SbcCD ATPase subunit [Flammeovirga kamogawensis]QWG05819.1 ATP-binding protein [Flammeovirga kamogawensis]TRX67645.1 ATP-binding protein [Flammeovirga kamogawensis]
MNVPQTPKRFLNKLVLIKSAGFDYAEVDLSGNVHFVGSNGFGKTTVLRAVLFFYHATSEKRELGIKEQQMSFSEYYFQDLNARLIYEIQTPRGKHCLTVYKSGGRLKFRFIDAAYNKNFFIKDRKACNHEEVLDLLSKGEVTFSDEIRRFADLRKVIYGVSKNNTQYSLLKPSLGVKSHQVDGIPKAITNIFRSSGLKSDYIKRAIGEAASADHEMQPISLETIANFIHEFDDQLTDFEDFEKNKSNAEEIVGLEAEITQQLSYQQRLAKQIGGGVALAEKHLADSEKLLAQMQVEENEMKKKYESAEEVYQTKTAAVNQELGEVKATLKEIERREKEYASISISGKSFTIEKLIELCAEEPRIKDQLIYQQEVKQMLVAQTAQVERLIDDQKKSLEQKFTARKSEFNEGKQLLREQFHSQKEKLSGEKQTALEELRNKYFAREGEFRVQLDQAKELKTRAEVALEIEKEKDFSKSLLSESNTMRVKLSTDIKEHKQAILETENTIKNTKERRRLEEQIIRNEARNQQAELERQLKLISDEVDEWKLRQEDYEGTFRSFLDQNKSDWSESIGKVCDEELLSRKDLNPSIVTGDSFYGINLEVGALTSKVTSTDNIATILEQKEAALVSAQINLSELDTIIDKKVEALIGNYSKKLGQLEQKLSDLTSKVVHLETALKEAREQEASIIEKANVLKEAALVELRRKFRLAQEACDSVEGKLSDLKDDRWSQENETSELYTNKLNVSSSEIETKVAKLEQEWAAYEGDHAIRIKELEEERKGLLEEKGIDTEKLQEVEIEIQALLSKIKDVEQAQIIKRDYEKDKIYYLDAADETRNKKKYQEKELENLKGDYNKAVEEYEEQLNYLDDKRDTYRRTKDHSNHLLKQFKAAKEEDEQAYVKLQKYLDEGAGNVNEAEINDGDLSFLLTELRKSLKERNRLSGAFKSKGQIFTGVFRKENHLKIPTLYAQSSLQEFIYLAKNILPSLLDGERLAHMKDQLEKQHREIISSVARQVKDLSDTSDLIKKIVKDINNGFARSNFVGVVKSIELEYNENNTPLLTTLKKIYRLNQDVAFTDQGDIFKVNINASSKDSRQSVQLLKDLRRVIKDNNQKQITLEDTFMLRFRVIENNNDTGWVEKLSNVGSEGTDVLVKSMIYITLLTVFQENAYRDQHDYFVHCVIDEVGKLSDRYLRDLIHYTNSKNIRLIFGSPNENDPSIYDHVLKLERNSKSNKASIVKLVSEM